ncbi:hypothetical protein ABW19_dt0204644 [Dactylella cylindrospora]|nr:hypothetical protein ABW19_dt0204644 [Dactylella cylindrospora]
MISAVTNGIEGMDTFDKTSEYISVSLKELESTLHSENQKWCNNIGEELETNIRNWLTFSDKVEQDEKEEREKLKNIVQEFEEIVQDLVVQANLLKVKF